MKSWVLVVVGVFAWPEEEEESDDYHIAGRPIGLVNHF
jgi:hypothetical protein